MKQISLLLLVLLLVSQNVQCELKFVIEQYRHGARGPLAKYYDYYEQIEIAGQLTPTGIRQHYVLGSYLREQYIEQQNFLQSTYNHSQIYVLSTDVNRTIMSALSQLSGLYPIPTGPDVPKNLSNQDYLLPPYQGLEYTDQGSKALDLGFQTIPIHSQSHNPGLDPTYFCPNASKIINSWKREPKQQYVLNNFYDQFQSTAQQIGQLINYTNLSVSQLPGVNSNFQCDRYNGRPLPAGLTPDLNRNLSYVSDFLGYFDMNCPTYRKIVNTKLFMDYLGKLDNAVAGRSQLKWYMVSAHDTNLQYVLPFLNITSTSCITDQYNFKPPSGNCQPLPQFAASLIIELHYLNSEFQIMIKYNGVYQQVCNTNSTTCPYSQWRNLIVQNIYTDEQFDLVCGNTNSEEHSYLMNFSLLPLFKSENFTQISIIVIQCVAIILLTLRLAKQKINSKKQISDDSQQQQLMESY